MRKVWFDEAWDDYVSWQREDKKTLKRINALVKGMTAAKYPMISALFLPEIMRTGKYKGQDYPIKSLYVYSGNPVCNQVNTCLLYTSPSPRDCS